MGQVVTGIRRILSSPTIYDAFQNLMGAKRFRRNFVNEFIRAKSGDRVLDIGCGTAEILDFLPDVHYWGVDVSESYIASARRRHGDGGRFECRILSESDVVDLPRFDIVLALGVFHHLDEGSAYRLLRVAHAALRPGGRFVSFDPSYAKDQNPISHFLVSIDRGLNVRDCSGYENMATRVFDNVSAVVRHRAWIPYTHCIMECTR